MVIASSVKVPEGTPPDRRALVLQPIDTHLIMNAMNQMAAMDRAAGRGENPVLFALSDYLREALFQIYKVQVEIFRERQLLQAYLELKASMSQCVFDLDFQGDWGSDIQVFRGVLAEIVSQFIAGTDIESGAHCQLSLVMDAGPNAQIEGVSVRLNLTRIGSTHAVAESVFKNRMMQLNCIVNQSATWINPPLLRSPVSAELALRLKCQ
ncbi:MAG: hypothetical protein KAY82_02300 [Hylemonella sp.]|nr:hypothetical protein [Hylemonella sp.]